MNRRILGLFLAACCLAFAPGASANDAASSFAANTVAERETAIKALREARQTPDTAMALATWQAFSAIERFGQTLHRNGFKSPRTAIIPLMQLPIPENPAPETMTYEKWRGILTDLVADLDEAKSMLADIGSDAEIGLDVDLSALRFDLNADGMLDESESVAAIFRAINDRTRGGRTARAQADDTAPSPPSLSFRFDRADGYWLQGYANFLTANARMWLAHDFRVTFDSSFQLFFPGAGMTAGGADGADASPRKFSDMINDNLYLRLKFAKSADLKKTLSQQFEALPAEERERLKTEAEAEMARHLAELRQGSSRGFGTEIFDAISLLHTINWPVTDAAARAQIRLDLLEMVRLSRLNWQSIQAETDNEREWLPGPQQPGPHPLTTLEVTEKTVAGWHDALDLFENVLEGKILLPHMRFARKGINLKRFFDEPSSFDLVLTITGPGALPYLETGPQASGREWRRLARSFGRNGFFAYAIWFN